jgi:predicted enzyme related to lactoylglutathione lyase
MRKLDEGASGRRPSVAVGRGLGRPPSRGGDMSERERYPPGVPCWVETLQRDPREALEFYRGVFGWEFVGPGPMPGRRGEYFVARVRGRDVAGVGSAAGPDAARTPSWSTFVRVASADETAETARRAGGVVRDGPFDVLPAGRMAVLDDPAGATFCVWEARAREGAQVVNEPRAWAMSLLHTPDPEGAKAFYGATFGWKAEPFEAGGARLTLWRLLGYVGGEPEQPVPRDVVAVMVPTGGSGTPGEVRAHWGVGFWIESVERAAEDALRLGGKVVVPPDEAPGFRTAVLADPEGAAFSVSQLVAAPPVSP